MALAYTIVSTDNGKTFDTDSTAGAYTFTLPAAATIGNNFKVGIRRATSSANAVTVTANAADGINGGALGGSKTVATLGDVLWLYSTGVAGNATGKGWYAFTDVITPNSGAVTSVTASAPLASSGGTTPNITITNPLPVANGGTNQSAALVNNAGLASMGGAMQEMSAIASAAGTDVVGQNVALNGGLGTGKGEPGILCMRYGLKGASGTTAEGLTALVTSGSTTSYIMGSALFANSGNGNTIANSVAAASLLLNLTGTQIIKGGLLRPGRCIRVVCRGIVSTTGTPTQEFAMYLGSTAIWDTGAVSMLTNAANNSWGLDVLITCRVYGGAGVGSVVASGFITEAKGGTPIIFSGDTGSQTLLDLTVDQTLDVKFAWGAASPSNTITMVSVLAEILN